MKEFITILKESREECIALIADLNHRMPQFDAVFEGKLARDLRSAVQKRLEYNEDQLALNWRLDK